MSEMYKHPIFLALFLINTLAAVTSIITGVVLIESSLEPASMTDAYDALAQEKSPLNFMTPENRKDLTYMQYSNSIIGSLAIIFSLVFVWNAVDIAIILLCGRKPQDSCYYVHLVKKELRSIVNKQRTLTESLDDASSYPSLQTSAP